MMETRLGLVVLVVGLAAVPTSGFPLGTPAGPHPVASVPPAGVGQESGFGQEAKLVAPDPEPEAFFGHDVALDGDTLVVSAPSEEDASGSHGAVYVFQRSSSGWTRYQRLLSPETTHAAFGSGLALDGDTLLVSDPWRHIDGISGAGAIHFYHETNGTWNLHQTVTGESRYDLLGTTIAIDEGHALVASFDHSGNNQPETHSFARVNGTWRETQLLEHGPTGGPSLAVDDGTAIIGREGEDRAYAYDRTSGRWSLTETIKDPTPHPGDRFGWGVDIDGDRSIVGEFFGDQAHVFRKRMDGWTLEATLPKPAGASSTFGKPVAIQGDLALVGAQGEAKLGWQAPVDEGLGNGAGAVYVYRYQESTTRQDWIYQGRITARDAGRGDLFGNALAIDGDTIAVGAKQDDHGEPSRLGVLGAWDTFEEGDQGSAYVFSPDDDGDSLANRTEDWIGTRENDPDTDRDGFDDGTEVACGWDPADGSSPSSGGSALGVVDPRPVPLGEHRWWLCGGAVG